MCFTRAKAGQSSVPCSWSRKAGGVISHEEVVFGLPVSLPAEWDRGMERGHNTWFLLCIDIPITSAAEIAVTLLMPCPRPP